MDYYFNLANPMRKMHMILLKQFMHKNVHSSSHPYRLGAMPFVDLAEILVVTGDPLTGLCACRLVGLTVGMTSTVVEVAGPLALASEE